MQIKFHTFLILLTLGLFLLPDAMYACGTKVEKQCCSKAVSSDTAEKKCWKSHAPEKEADDCGGKCGHANCTSTSASTSFAIFTDVQFNSHSFNFSSEKQLFYNSKTFISAGFSSLWLIPKIV